MKGTPAKADGGRQMVPRPDTVTLEPSAAQETTPASAESAEVGPGSRQSHTPDTAADASPALFAARTPPRWDAHHTAWDGELWT